MGTHLCKEQTTSYIVRDGTRIHGDSIRARAILDFGADGSATTFPMQRIPRPRRSTPTRSSNTHHLHVHDEEGSKPDFKLPAMPEWDDQSYVRWKLDHMASQHPRAGSLDNMTAYAHLCGPRLDRLLHSRRNSAARSASTRFALPSTLVRTAPPDDTCKRVPAS